MPMPQQPHADRLADELSGKLIEWHRRGGAPPQLLVKGESGSGKTWSLSRIASNLRENQIEAVLIAPPAPDFDAPVHAALQGAGALRGAGVNGVLDPVFELDRPVARKLDAVVDGLRCRSAVVLLDLPRFSTFGADGKRPEVVLPREATLGFLSTLRQPSAGAPALVVAARELVNEHKGLTPFQLDSMSEDEILDPVNWGELHDAADRLRSHLGPNARHVSPLGMRLAVALVGLGERPVKVATTYRLGISALQNAFQTSLRDRPVLARALRLLRFPRVPVPQQVVTDLLMKAGAYAFRNIVNDALLMDSGERRVLHPGIRELVTEAERDLEKQETIETNRLLRDLFKPCDVIASRQEAIERLEFVHHAALAGDVEQVEAHAIDATAFIALGRALSFQERFKEAEAVFDHAWSLTHLDYARQYRAYNRERDRGADAKVEQDYEASRAEAPTNPWWNRRYIVCLLGRGKVQQARAAFLESLENLGAADAAWLARNFQAGVARAFLDRNHLDDAEQVLETIPPEAANEEIGRLWNELRHRRETRTLQDAVFPTTVAFDQRWTDGPHLATEAERETCTAWYPGRIEALDDEGVTVVFCEPPEDGDAPQLLRKTIPVADFEEAASMRRELFRVGAFLEFIETDTDVTRVKFYPSGPSFSPFRINHLRRFDVSGAHP